MKSIVFANRNFKELVRDPLSWIFCLGFPLVMLAIMTVINNSIPAEAGMTLFEIESLAPGIMIFGLTFVMLFACLLIAGDRNEAFLLRIFTSPMKSSDYIMGYIIPLIVLCFGQVVVTLAASLILALASGDKLSIPNMLFSVVTAIPSMFMFIGFGLLFGTLFNKNAAPGLSSIIISFSGILGGIWMDVDTIGGTLADICKALPFYHCVKSARLAFGGDFSGSMCESGIVLIWAVIVVAVSIIVFKKKMRF
ncbi:MAG: ABC transporter permease [Ruminiclostridium sp.]|nr:ABC transporter permease [Ruminiclostridium sp.]